MFSNLSILSLGNQTNLDLSKRKKKPPPPKKKAKTKQKTPNKTKQKKKIKINPFKLEKLLRNVMLLSIYEYIY